MDTVDCSVLSSRDAVQEPLLYSGGCGLERPFRPDFQMFRISRGRSCLLIRGCIRTVRRAQRWPDACQRMDHVGDAYSFRRQVECHRSRTTLDGPIPRTLLWIKLMEKQPRA